MASQVDCPYRHLIYCIPSLFLYALIMNYLPIAPLQNCACGGEPVLAELIGVGLLLISIIVPVVVDFNNVHDHKRDMHNEYMRERK